MNSLLTVGAYAASPALATWNPELEAEFFRGLREIPEIGCLEIPFFGSLHKFDADWFLRNIDPKWNYVLTLIPGTMDRLKDDPEFGLASCSVAGQNRALEFTEAARQAVLKLNQFLGRKAVIGVEIHSAPKLGVPGAQSSVDDLSKSLSRIAQWDWDGAELWIEHCDHWKEGQEPAKGFLPLEDEIEAIEKAAATLPPNRLATRLGILINWGRSAIEARDADEPRRHLEKARKHGVLRGLIFSGATLGDSLYGNWADSHAPFDATCKNSLLTPEHVRHCLKEAQAASAPCIGFKMQTLPKELNVAERLIQLRSYVSSMQVT